MAAAQFDPLNPTHRPDPHTLYRRMRAEAPVYRGSDPRTGQPLWFLTSYAAVRQALRHPDLRRDLDRLPADLAAPHRAARNDTLAGQGLDRHLLNQDPPDHTRLRQLVTPAFAARATAAMAPRVRAITDRLLDGLAHATGPVDLIEALAAPLPVTVIAELLGVPVADQHQFRGWVDDLLRGGDRRRRQRSGADLTGYLNQQIADRRRLPGTDLLSQLVSAQQGADRLSHTELLSTAFLLLVAGHETTVNLIGNGVVDLLRHPGELARLRQRPELLGSAVEEMIRFNGPVEASTLRYAAAEVEICGTVIPRGEAVLPVLLAANRDPAAFAEPDRFDLARVPNRHLGFGHGVHFCLGATLARLEGRVAIEALIRRFPSLSLATAEARLEWVDAFPLRGLRRLPVRLRPAQT